jgi:hypothetical protein
MGLDGGDRRRIALKFCGGCNPDYERTAYWEAIRLAAGETVQWVRLEDDDYQAVLLICGCPTACPRDEMPPGAKLVCLSDARLPAEDVLEMLREKE